MIRTIVDLTRLDSRVSAPPVMACGALPVGDWRSNPGQGSRVCVARQCRIACRPMAHGTSLALLAGLALVSTSCSRPSGGLGLPPSAGAPAGPGGGSASVKPAQQPAPDQPAGLPPNHFDRVPGWLGFTVRAADKRTRGWTPAHPNATAVILDADAWSETVEEGTRFRLVSREGNLPLTLSEVSQIPYGCDQNKRTMAAFRTPNDPAEQLVWILPEGYAAATALPVIRGSTRKHQRSWTVGPLAIRVQLDGKLDGRLEVREGSALVLARPFEKPAMEGADMAPLDLTRELEIGVPYVEAAFRIGPALTIVVLRTVTYEGVSFEVLARRDKLERAGAQYVYLCAF